MKKLASLVLALIMVFSVAGTAACAENAPVEIEFFTNRSFEGAAATDLEKDNFVEQYLREKLGVDIRYVYTDELTTNLNLRLFSGDVPDVFNVENRNYLKQYADEGYLLNLDEHADKLADAFAFTEGNASAGKIDGATYAIPGRPYGFREAYWYNVNAFKKAGVTEAELADMTWNPKDGGSFGKIIAKLTVDEAGNNATSPSFDKTKVAVYGYQTPGDGGMMGQREWSHFAVTNGFKFQDKPWDAKFYYDDPKLAETVSWLAGLTTKGISASLTEMGTGRMESADAMFVAGKVAIIPNGSWMITHFAANAKFPYAWIPLPKGPSGKRASMFNGLADSIWVGSKHKEQAWKWVKYLGSSDCQSVVASHGVVFPAIKGLPEKAIEVQKGKGVNSSAFLDMAKSQTFLAPISDNGSQVNDLMVSAMQTILMGKADAAATLKDANAKINALGK